MICLFFLTQQPVVLPPCLREQILDFGVLSATDTRSLVFVVVNSNPIEVGGHHVQYSVTFCNLDKNRYSL